MTIWELLLTAVAVAMDALAAAVTIGAGFNRASLSQALKVGIYFGLFQAGMPALGLWAGQGLHQCIQLMDHWAAFGLMSIIGIRMIWEDIRPQAVSAIPGNPFAAGHLIMLALATSIDALAVGISLAMADGYSASSGLVIGLVTFLLCTLGTLLGKQLRRILKNRTGLAGGILLIGMGLKILLHHLLWGI